MDCVGRLIAYCLTAKLSSVITIVGAGRHECPSCQVECPCKLQDVVKDSWEIYQKISATLICHYPLNNISTPHQQLVGPHSSTTAKACDEHI